MLEGIQAEPLEGLLDHIERFVVERQMASITSSRSNSGSSQVTRNSIPSRTRTSAPRSAR